MIITDDRYQEDKSLRRSLDAKRDPGRTVVSVELRGVRRHGFPIADSKTHRRGQIEAGQVAGVCIGGNLEHEDGVLQHRANAHRDLSRAHLLFELLHLRACGRCGLSSVRLDGGKREPHSEREDPRVRLHSHVSLPSGFLREIETADSPVQVGRRVVVYGGGNTAIDMARTARRLGARETIVVYRRSREKMPAHDFEVREALEERVILNWLSTIKRVEPGGVVTVEKMALDDDGWPQGTGEFEELEADTLILALGQDVDTTFIERLHGVEVADGVVQVGPNLMPGYPGVFCGGDMVPGERTITVAVGHGRKAAFHIDAWLHGTTFEKEPRHELATFDLLNPWYYADAPVTVQPQLDEVRRQTTFEEVHGGLDESTAMYEAKRCLSCGNCFECDNCYGVCPDNAVIKLGPGRRFRFNYDYCKGCGMCVAECPCGAIKIVPEEI